jgi:aminoglycoside 2''-phosphotransferase
MRIIKLVSMLATINGPDFQQEVQAAISGYFKETSLYDIDYIEHGNDNFVVIVNKQLVFRFPRSEPKARRIAFETAILQKTKDRISVVQTPELVQVHMAPLYLVSKYVDGEHFTSDQIKALSEADQQVVGARIAEFIFQFNQAISGLEVRRLRTESGVDSLEEPWPTYFVRLFEGTQLPNDTLRPVVAQYYPLWKDYALHEQNNYAIHDDLHLANLLFSGNKLSGVVDFGDTNCGSIESELRWLYLMGETVVRAAVDRYQSLSGVQLNHDHIRVWAIMHELSTFTDRLAKQQTEVFPFKRAQQNLRNWIPSFPL